MKIGFFTANLAHLDIEEVARIASENGYEMLEIPAYVGNGQLDCDEVLNGRAKKIKDTVKKYGLDISALSNHAETMCILGANEDTDEIFEGTPEEKIAFGTKSLIKCAQAANALEVPVVNGFTGCVNFGRYFHYPSAKGWEKMEELFVERFTPILDEFKKYGVKFAMEPHPNNIVYDIQTAKRAVELLDGHPCWGYNLDPANLTYLGLKTENFIDLLGDRIFHVHAKDAEVVEHNVQMGGVLMQGDMQRLGQSFRFRIPGWGDVEWKKIITELSMVGYDYVMSYEHEDVTMSVEDGIEKTIAYLRPLIIKAPYAGRTDKIFNH